MLDSADSDSRIDRRDLRNAPAATTMKLHAVVVDGLSIAASVYE